MADIPLENTPGGLINQAACRAPIDDGVPPEGGATKRAPREEPKKEDKPHHGLFGGKR